MTSWSWIRISQHFTSNEHKWNIYKYLVIYVAQVWNDSADGNVSQHDVTREVHPMTQLELHQLTRHHPRHHRHLPSSVTAGVVVVFILLKVYAVVLGFLKRNVSMVILWATKSKWTSVIPGIIVKFVCEMYQCYEVLIVQSHMQTW